MARSVKHPTAEGVFWASLDDGERVVEVVLLDVRFYAGQKSFEDGAYVRFVDGSRRYFEMESIDQQIVQPGVMVTTVVGPSFSKHDQVKVTWLEEVKPPKNAPEVGTPV